MPTIDDLDPATAALRRRLASRDPGTRARAFESLMAVVGNDAGFQEALANLIATATRGAGRDFWNEADRAVYRARLTPDSPWQHSPRINGPGREWHRWRNNVELLVVDDFVGNCSVTAWYRGGSTFRPFFATPRDAMAWADEFAADQPPAPLPTLPR